MKIAFATSNNVAVDEQFRRASNLVVYEVTASGHRLDRIRAFVQDRTARTQERIRAIDGAALVYVTAIGPSTAARLAAQGIRPATVPAGTTIERILVDHLAQAQDAATLP